MTRPALCSILVIVGLCELVVDVASEALRADGCNTLIHKYPGKTFFPGDKVYDYESQAFWSNTELMNPTCIFRPERSEDVADLIAVAAETNTDFAVRGGGHTSFQGANNIDNGVLVVLNNLTHIELSEDKSTVVLGPGHRWGAVYSYLRDYNLTVPGGRLSPVGVPGLLLAGGMSYYGNQYGWSADNVLDYEIVLPSGAITHCSSHENSDLFWSLKGGSNNFGIVTSFTMRTIESTQIYAGIYSVSSDYMDDFLAAVANFSAFNTDPRAHAIPQAISSAENSSTGAVVLFYDSATESNPDCFAPFFDIPATNSTWAVKTVADFAVEFGGLVIDNINDMIVAGTTTGADYNTLLKGIRITYDIFFGALPDLYAVVPYENFSLVSIDWQTISSMWQAGSRSSNPNGNALGINTESKGTYLCWVQFLEWVRDDDSDAINAWVENTTALINNATQAAGVYDAFNYMGDATGFQDVYTGYGAENQAKLLEISRKYDPDRVFQKRLPGGFKIGE